MELSNESLLNPEVFVSHRNAPLSPTGRLRLARCVVEDRWPLRRAADRFDVSVTTAKRWAGRYRDAGPAGVVDRSSRPRSCPHRTSRRRERRVIGLRVSRRWGPARIAFHLRLNVSTVHRILTRYRCLRLSWTDPATGAPVRARRREVRWYEHHAPGDLIRVDIRKGAAARLGDICSGLPGRAGLQGWPSCRSRIRRSFVTTWSGWPRERESGVTFAQIAKDFGIHEMTLQKWLRRADIDKGRKQGTTSTESAELRELRKRNRLLEHENDVLRRAAAYLSQANLPGQGSTRS